MFLKSLYSLQYGVKLFVIYLLICTQVKSRAGPNPIILSKALTLSKLLQPLHRSGWN
jgi:hypothetical protein